MFCFGNVDKFKSDLNDSKFLPLSGSNVDYTYFKYNFYYLYLDGVSQ